MGFIDRVLSVFGGTPSLGTAIHEAAAENLHASASTSMILPSGATALKPAYGVEYSKRLFVDENRDGIRTPWVPVQPRWLPEDVDIAWQRAEEGELRPIAKLIEAMRADSTVSGLMKTRASMVRLPVKFEGDPYLCQELEGIAPVYSPEGLVLSRGIQGMFDVMCPVPALMEMIYTGVMAGVAIAELVDDPETGVSVLTPHDLYWLRFDWGTRQWIYYGGKSPVVVTPGDGRWVVWTPDSMNRPWKSGAWLSCALPFVTKIAAVYDRLRWQAQLADPLKYFKTTNAISPKMRQDLEYFIENYWMRAPGIVLPVGVEAGVMEVDGKGFEVYLQAEQWAEGQIAKALSGGQKTTSEGGMGFGDGDIFSEINENIIQGTATSLAQCVTKQVIKKWAERKYPYRLELNGGVPPQVSWDVRSPARRSMEAEILGKMSDSALKANTALKEQGMMVDVPAYFAANGVQIPLMHIAKALPALPAAPSVAQLPPGPTP